MANRASDWTETDAFWRNQFRTRPYCSASSDYDFYRPGYRYGFEAAQRNPNRNWSDLEPDLKKAWNSYEHRGTSTWEQVKDAVRDAWDRVIGHERVGSR